MMFRNLRIVFLSGYSGWPSMPAGYCSLGDRPPHTDKQTVIVAVAACLSPAPRAAGRSVVTGVANDRFRHEGRKTDWPVSMPRQPRSAVRVVHYFEALFLLGPQWCLVMSGIIHTDVHACYAFQVESFPGRVAERFCSDRENYGS